MPRTPTRSLTFKLPPVVCGGCWSCGQSSLHRREQEATKDRPAVVTPAILETHGRIAPTLKAFLAKIAPEDQQARATWLQEAMRRISCVLQIHSALIIAKCNGTI